MLKDISKNKLIYISILIFTLLITIIGTTYAYLAFTVTDRATIYGSSATVTLDLEVEKVFPLETSTNTGVMVPQLSTSNDENSPLASALRNGCVDGNNNVICQVYKIVVSNNGGDGDANFSIKGEIAFYSDANMTNDVGTILPNLKWKLIDSVDTTTPANSLLGTNLDLSANSNLNSNIFANNVILNTNSTKTYYIIIWINETGTNQAQDLNKSFYAKIHFESSIGNGITSTFSSSS